jgi:hypothetical protein
MTPKELKEIAEFVWGEDFVQPLSKELIGVFGRGEKGRGKGKGTSKRTVYQYLSGDKQIPDYVADYVARELALGRAGRLIREMVLKSDRFRSGAKMWHSFLIAKYIERELRRKGLLREK